MNPSPALVLELFPGVSLFGHAFEELGYCVVRGPDPIFSSLSRIEGFRPPSGRFEGIIGGPPCQQFSRLANLVRHNGHTVAPNLIPEFERVVVEAQPEWFLMENVQAAPLPSVSGYQVHAQLVRDVWVGGETSRLRRFSFGTRDGRALEIVTLALHSPNPLPAVLACGGTWVPVKLGGSGKPKKGNGRLWGDKSAAYFHAAKRAQGLPADFDIESFTVTAKIKAIGNGVPLAMGRAVAKAVNQAMQPGPGLLPCARYG
jgi:DNA (cytosine-5)-methyltransferase 1